MRIATITAAENASQYQIERPAQFQPRLDQKGRLPNRVTTAQQTAIVSKCATIVERTCTSRRVGDFSHSSIWSRATMLGNGLPRADWMKYQINTANTGITMMARTLLNQTA